MIHKDTRIGCGLACIRYYGERVVVMKARQFGFTRVQRAWADLRRA